MGTMPTPLEIPPTFAWINALISWLRVSITAIMLPKTVSSSAQLWQDYHNGVSVSPPINTDFVYKHVILPLLWVESPIPSSTTKETRNV